jgi:hypothetical protein
MKYNVLHISTGKSRIGSFTKVQFRSLGSMVDINEAAELLLWEDNCPSLMNIDKQNRLRHHCLELINIWNKGRPGEYLYTLV